MTNERTALVQAAIDYGCELENGTPQTKRLARLLFIAQLMASEEGWSALYNLALILSGERVAVPAELAEALFADN